MIPYLEEIRKAASDDQENLIRTGAGVISQLRSESDPPLTPGTGSRTRIDLSNLKYKPDPVTTTTPISAAELEAKKLNQRTRSGNWNKSQYRQGISAGGKSYTGSIAEPSTISNSVKYSAAPTPYLEEIKKAQLITPEFEKSVIDNYYDSKDPSHGYEGHVLPVRQTAAEIALARKMDALPMEDLDTAALLHDITRNSDKTDSHHETGSIEAARLLEEQGVQRERIEAIKHMIKNHRASSKIPDDLSEGAKVLRDADRIAEGNPLQRSYNYHLHNNQYPSPMHHSNIHAYIHHSHKQMHNLH